MPVRESHEAFATDAVPLVDHYLRGVDLFRMRHGKVAEKLSYVKG
jgi:hypothetical protein